MEIKSVEDTDRILEQMHKLRESDENLKKRLEKSVSYQQRWIILENYILRKLDSLGLSEIDYQRLWIRERYIYETQQKTGLDYGFCSHFKPKYRNLAQSILTDDFSLDFANECNHGGETLETICNGTSRDTCVHLHPEFRMLRYLNAEEIENN